MLSDEKAKAKHDALWEGQHSTLAKEERGGNGVEPKEQAAHRHAADNFARGLLAARRKQEKAAREQREQAAQRHAARVKEEEARAHQAAALEKEEKNRKEQYKAREQRAVRERAEREQAARGREERGKSALLFMLSHQAQGARHQGPFAEHFAWEQRGLADREQATREKEAREKESREEQTARGRWASREQGVWERTDQTRGRAALQWARMQASLLAPDGVADALRHDKDIMDHIREKAEHARGRDAREPRERARVPDAPEIFARERATWKRGFKATWKREFNFPWREAGPPNHLDDKVDSDLGRELQGQLRRSWTHLGSRRVLKPLPPKLASRKSSL